MTAGNVVAAFPADAELRCTGHELVIRTRDGARRQFPADATILDVYQQNAVYAVFPGEKTSHEIADGLRRGTFRLLRTL